VHDRTARVALVLSPRHGQHEARKQRGRRAVPQDLDGSRIPPAEFPGSFGGQQKEQQHNSPSICRVLFSCNKVDPEIHALARNHGVAELEQQVGKLEKYKNDYVDEADDEDGYDSEEDDVPFQVQEVVADEAQHFVLSREQWKQLRFEESCTGGCTRYMSLFTYYNRDSVDVKSILKQLYIF